MLFNSLEYLLFLPTVVGLFYLMPHRARQVFILLASYFFYMYWKPQYVILILISTGVDFVAARMIGQTPDKVAKRRWLLLSLVSNLGLLFTFKYFNFVAGSVNQFALLFSGEQLLPRLDILLPVGISFYTFQTLSYTIDVYRGNLEPEQDLISFSLYVTYFPQLVAGPIERASRLLWQLKKEQSFNFERFKHGIRIIGWGMFKKVVVADRLAPYVNAVYTHPSRHGGLTIWTATYFFAAQIYCDFSGYSDIAIGTAALMGVSLMDNFRTPYFSASIREFWTRWHISLSSWFRDYVFIPLGGSRCSRSRYLFNVLVVFMVSGLWHGANWTFVVWGALHGSYFALEVFVLDPLLGNRTGNEVGAAPRAIRFLRTLLTFHLTLVAWVFFRAESVSSAILVISRAWSGELKALMPKSEFYFSIALLFFLFLVERAQQKGPILERLDRLPAAGRWSAYLFVVFALILFAKRSSAFIYFQF